MLGVEEEEQIEFVNFPEVQLPEHRAMDFLTSIPSSPWIASMPLTETHNEKGFMKSGAGFVEVPRCPPKPIRLPSTFCYVNRAEYSLLRSEISNLLSNLVDYDFSYDEGAYMVRITCCPKCCRAL